MNELIFSPRAVRDLDEILQYISVDRPDTAIQIVARLEQECEKLAEFPKIGVLRNELIEGLRALPVGNYIVYYTQRRGGVRIERVIHAARDREAIFGDEADGA